VECMTQMLKFVFTAYVLSLILVISLLLHNHVEAETESMIFDILKHLLDDV